MRTWSKNSASVALVSGLLWSVLSCAALADVKSAIRFHVETFGAEVLEDESHVLEAFVAEADVN